MCDQDELHSILLLDKSFRPPLVLHKEQVHGYSRLNGQFSVCITVIAHTRRGR